MEKLVLSGVLVLASCGLDAIDGAGREDGADPEFRATPDVSLVQATDSEWVVEWDQPVAVCPNDGNWDGKSIYDVHPFLSTNAPTVPKLQRFCRYTWIGPVPPSDNPLPSPPPGASYIVAKNPITVGVAPQGVLRDALGPYLLDRFRWRYRHPGVGSSFEGSADLREPVVLAIVDTKPNDPGQPGKSNHGRIMIELAKPIVCPPDSTGCAVEIMPTLGMPRTGVGANWDEGGYYGAVADVALGVIEAVQRWKTRPDSPRLVISLALGIDLETFDPNGNGTGASRNLLLDALRWASCEGALIVAAAGNDVGLGTSGALYPATLEAEDMPGEQACNNFLNGSYQVDTTPYAPLVHAVGGLDDNLGELDSARPDSTPRLVAAATAGIAPLGPSQWTFPATGTSVSTTVTSSTAALVLSFDDTLGRNAVMQRLHDSGRSTNISAAVYFGASQPDVKRVDLCGTLEDVCVGGTDACTAVTLDCSLGNQLPYSDAFLADQLALLSLDPETQTYRTTKQCTAIDGELRQTAFSTGGGILPPTCASIDYQPLDVIAAPQPDLPVCDTCSGSFANNLAHVEFAPTYEDEIVSRMIITVEDAQREYHDLVFVEPDISTIEPNEIDIDMPLPSDVKSASVTFFFQSGIERRDTMNVLD